jgi:integrase
MKNESYGTAITFASFAKRWMELVLVHQKPSSQSSVRSQIRAHLLPTFGSTYMADIRVEMLQRFVTYSKSSPKMLRNVVGTLMTMWTTAQAWGYVQHNPFLRSATGRLLLKFPPTQAPRTYHFSLEECVDIINKAEGKWKTFFLIMAETGMRPGEVAGLKRDAITDCTLTVSQSVWGQRVQTPKTRTAVRTIAISPELSESIQKLIAESESNECGLLFSTERWRIRANQHDRKRVNQHAGGKPLSMDNFRNRVLEPILVELGIREKLNKLGIKRCGNYAFRHMNATLMDRINTPMKTRQLRLGHAQIETTMKYYTHAVGAEDRRAAEAIGALLSGGGKAIVQ